MIMKNFIATKERLPEIGQLVWLYDSKRKIIYLGERANIGDKLLWAVSYGKPYLMKGKILADCQKDDAYDFDYWAEIPELPEIESQK